MHKKEEEFILDWAEQYVKHRDMIFRNIKDVDRQQDCFIVRYKDDSFEKFLPKPDLNMLDLKDAAPSTTIITLNTKNNFKILLDKWRSFAEVKELKLIFFNPDSELEQRWIIKPYIHNRICDEKTLKQGLKAMFHTVQVLA